MKFKTGFLIGAAAGAWAVKKAASLQPNRSQEKGAPPGADEAAEKLRALSGLARERLSELIDGPLGTMARERVADLIGSSLGGVGNTAESDRAWSGGAKREEATIDASARWPG